MNRILVISSSPADVGILIPVVDRLADSHRLDIHLLLTGMHIGGNPPNFEVASKNVTVHEAGADLMGCGGLQASKSMATIAESCGKLYSHLKPNLIVLTGDRLDMFPCAMASTPYNIPLAHLHGGEVTLGAIDDRLRHALTKLSHLHFAATADAANRICSMGEEPWRIRVTGAPGLDTLRSARVIDRASLMGSLGFTSGIDQHLRLVALHPETNGYNPLEPTEAVLNALDKLPRLPTIFTGPNSDPGGRELRTRLKDFVSSRPWAMYRETLGSVLYANCLRHAKILIGNTSSGIIEAPLFSLPFLNVGNRQRGRLQGDNVINVASESSAVSRVINRVIHSSEPRKKAGVSPYGDGNASERLVGVLENLPSREILLEKLFWTGGSSFTNPWVCKSGVE